jgi:hypothetical protein
MTSRIDYYLYSLCLLLATANASAVPLAGTMTIDPGTRVGVVYTGGSYFAMGADDPNGTAEMLIPLSTGPGGIVLGTYQNFVLNPDTPHPFNWDGAGASAGTGYSTPPVTPSDMLQPFSFFGVATHVGTNPVGYQSGDAHPAPTADYDDTSCVGTVCTLTIELSSWEVMWNGSAFEQGPRPINTGPFVVATGTYDTSTNAYSVSWASQINGGPFSGVTGYWHLEGTVIAPPAPAVTPSGELIRITGCSLVSGNIDTSVRAEWWLLGGFLGWLGAIRYRKRHRN